jgi:hypothetical protein
MKTLRTIAALAGALCICSTGAAADEAARAFTAKDLVMLDRVSDPQVAPDGQSVVFTVRETNWDANKGVTGLWRLALGAKESRPERITATGSNASSPRWAPDGSGMYFLAADKGNTGEAIEQPEFAECIGLVSYQAVLSTPTDHLVGEWCFRNNVFPDFHPDDDEYLKLVLDVRSNGFPPSLEQRKSMIRWLRAQTAATSLGADRMPAELTRREVLNAAPDIVSVTDPVNKNRFLIRVGRGPHIAHAVSLFDVLGTEIVFLLERHHQLDDVEGVGAQVFDEGRLRGHLILAHTELLTDDLPHSLLYAGCHPCPPSLTCTIRRSRRARARSRILPRARREMPPPPPRRPPHPAVRRG